ncbi:hypothetical protein [Actinotalea fermentans]|uniref:Uncharacterized protein n=1 Tax=Actinotalea fermentans TaxID=43671 RepID=A0A511YWC3_9CELL|nr:hypothetical protein [Actinotalea fermentans]GEN79513.1 hypothetical protein AFE02nite_12470 [Actinotalea fermentans]
MSPGAWAAPSSTCATSSGTASCPPAGRTASGYRRYTEAHVRWGEAYGALTTAVGPVEARTLVRTARTEPVERLAARLDEVHGRLSAERAAVRLAREAADAIAREPMRTVRPSDATAQGRTAGRTAGPASGAAAEPPRGAHPPDRSAPRGTTGPTGRSHRAGTVRRNRHEEDAGRWRRRPGRWWRSPSSGSRAYCWHGVACCLPAPSTA